MSKEPSGAEGAVLVYILWPGIVLAVGFAVLGLMHLGRCA